MNTPPDETTLTLWMDGELEGDDLIRMEAWAKDHPELLAERDAISALSRSIQDNIPASVEPPYPDFFNERILHAIEEDQPAPEPAPAPSPSGFWKWLVAPVAAGAMAICFYLGTQMQSGNPAQATTSPVLATSTVYTPDSSVEANIFVSGNEEATVIVLEGLDDIPDDLEMVGGPTPKNSGKVMVNTGEYY
ncbi:hypothetical protein NT6N_25550 [Oceaniferula spumae]|uniref:Anti-sigma factor n=1 Tax=Oceaniferula spumae TaxID=2979115 RepID=A0AAT9FNE4_9BACT